MSGYGRTVFESVTKEKQNKKLADQFLDISLQVKAVLTNQGELKCSLRRARLFMKKKLQILVDQEL